LGSNGKHRHMAAVAVEQAVDQMQIARTAASRANGESSGDSGFGTGGEGCHFLMANVHPGNFSKSSQTVVEPVQAVSGDAPNPLDAGIGEGLNQQIRDRRCRMTADIVKIIPPSGISLNGSSTLLSAWARVR
jgi:hypothetical protein